MSTLTLDDTSRDTLHDVLTAEAAEARIEGRRADVAAFKHHMRGHVTLLDGLVAGLAGTVALDAASSEALARILRRQLSDLRVEIRHTSTWSYKEQLKQRAAVLRGVLDQLPTAA